MQPIQAQATLKDICRAAGVSLYTASRALAGHRDVAEPTRLRVQAVAAQLGYVANQHARYLKGGKSEMIGVIAASKANPYYATLVSALEEVVESGGYSCFVADAVVNGVYRTDKEDRLIASLIQQRVAAVVLTCPLAEQNLALLAKWKIPVLFVDCPPTAPESHYPSVSIDNFAAGLTMGGHLAGLGYRQWCFVGYARNWTTRESRQQGFATAAAQCGAQLVVVEGGNDVEVARRGVHDLLTSLTKETRPQVIFAGNTILLKGTLLALRDCGLRVPEDMAVVAFDEFDWAALLTPPITVIDQHIARIGQLAGQRLLAILQQDLPPDAPREIVTSYTLCVRESCGALLAPAARPGANLIP